MLCGVEGVQAMLCGVEGVQVMLCGVEGVLGGGMWGKWSVGDAMWCLFGCLCPLGLCIDCMPTGLLVTDQYRAPPHTRLSARAGGHIIVQEQSSACESLIVRQAP